MLIERVVLRPIHDAPVLSHVVAFIALLSIFNSGAGFIWDWTIKNFASPFGSGQLLGQNLISKHDAGMIGVTILMLVLLYLFFRHTRIGLAMRAAAANPESARLAGIRVGWMTALGWGMAAAIGSVAGMLIAPVVFLEPNMMLEHPALRLRRRGGRRADQPGRRGVRRLCGRRDRESRRHLHSGGRARDEAHRSRSIIIVAVLCVKPSGLFGRPVVTRV